MPRIILVLIAGLLFFWGLAAHAATASPADTARCTKETLVANRITEAGARHLPIGRSITIAGARRVLTKGDSIWSLCSASGTTVANVEARIAALETQLSDAYGKADAAQKKATGALSDLEKANVQAAVAKAERERLEETSNRLWVAMAALIGLAVLLGATLAYTMLETARERRRLRNRTDGSAETLYEEVVRSAKLRSLLESVWPFATLGVIPYTLAPDAVESPASEEARSFTIAITRLVRMKEGIDAYCVLPWGHEMLYEPARVLRAIRSDAAQTYYLHHRSIVLKKTVLGRAILAHPLPDLERIIDESPAFVHRRAAAAAL